MCNSIVHSVFFFLDTVPTSRQPAIPDYQNIKFGGFILTLCSSNTTHDSSFVTFNDCLIFFLTVDFILTLCNSNITCDSSFVTFDGSLIFLTFNDYILTLCSSNITYDNSFVTIVGLLIFFSHLTVQSSYYAVLTSYVTVLLSHLLVPFFFFSRI